MNEELKACPFCGSTSAKADSNFGNDAHVITCRNSGCYASTAFCDSPEEAIAAWNRRASSWIPVTAETLPKEAPVMEREFENIRLFVPPRLQADGLFYGGEFWIWEYEISYCREEGYRPVKGVTHWRPLPSPPTTETT